MKRILAVIATVLAISFLAVSAFVQSIILSMKISLHQTHSATN